MFMAKNGKSSERIRGQIGVVLVVLVLIGIILIWWLVAGRQRESGSEDLESDVVGQTVIAGGVKDGDDEIDDDSPSNGSGYPGTNGSNEVNAINGNSDGDPLTGDTQLPDDGAGAEAELNKSNGTKDNPDLSLGIDVSKWQGKIDWQQVADSGVEFAMVRIGFRNTQNGEIQEDPYAAYNLQHAAEAGIQLGAYFFSTAISKEEVLEEANWTVDFLAGYPITYPVAYNCEGFLSESSRMYGISCEVRTSLALTFLDTVEAAGYEGMFYASKHDLTDGVSWNTAAIEERYPVWVAQYPSAPYPATEKASYDGKYHMWQYTSQGTVAGIAAHVDLNVAYFKYDTTAAPKNPGAAGEAGDVPIDATFTDVDELVTAKDVTNLRTEPSSVTNDTIAATLKNGEWVTRTGISSKGWSRVVYNGQTLYAVTSLLLTEEEAKSYENVQPATPAASVVYDSVNDMVTAKVETNLRDAASTEGTTVVATIQNGEWVTRTGIGSNGWSRLDYNGQTVYALTNYLTTDSDYDPGNVDDRNIVWTSTNKTMTAKDTTNLRDKPSTEGSNVVATIHHGDQVVCTAIGSNGWVRVTYEGQTLYAVESLLQEVN